ncbi:MaoC family dehydratase [uncultured Sneathiella sp.]|jgi:3-hydroxybutyryl-CoA dehydratase|uniref:MaoC family dehydratase n=1 Tax=uncultured Sneathiella sp. TaxID=879315 RepID=UPI00259AD622|nr:MaoC family dehydratase [uncultured Sneathiella sp.]
MTAEEQFNKVDEGEVITGRPFTVSRDTIQAFADASLDYNPLHFDDNYMKNKFGKTSFDGVIMHGMQNFALITRTLTDWLIPRGGFHRRLETRWLKPVQLGHTITPVVTLQSKKKTEKGYWLLFDVEVTNQDGMLVAMGNAMAEFIDVIPGKR